MPGCAPHLSQRLSEFMNSNLSAAIQGPLTGSEALAELLSIQFFVRKKTPHVGGVMLLQLIHLPLTWPMPFFLPCHLKAHRCGCTIRVPQPRRS